MMNNETITETRIRPLDGPYSPELERDFNTIMPPGMPPLSIFRTVAHNPRVLSRMVNGGLLDKGSISLADRELVILRTCAVCKAEYEWGVHVAGFAKKAGFSEEQIQDTANVKTNSAIWSASQQLLIALADQLHDSNQVDDTLWGKLSEEYDSAQLVELIMLAGLYHAVSFMVNACRIEGESFAPKFPKTSI